MVTKNVIDEYLVAIRPSVDQAAFDNALGKVSDKLNSKKRIWSNYAKLKFNLGDADRKLEELQSRDDASEEDIKKAIEDRDSAKLEFDKLQASMSGFDKGIAELIDAGSGVAARISQAGVWIGALIALFKVAIDVGEKLVDQGIEQSNKFVSNQSAFVDTEVKSIMANLGVDTTTAQGMNYALEGLGITMSDLSTATSAQRQAFQSLTNQYSEYLASIDPEKLERYNEVMQRYQLRELEMRMKLNTSFIEFFAESEALPRLVDDMGDMFEGLVNLLSSDAAQFAFETFISFIETLVGIISAPVNMLGGLLNGNTTNNNNDVKITQNNTYNNSVANNSNTELALQIRQALNG